VAEPLLPAPPAQRGAESDVYHGVAVADPYRWLEDGSAPSTVEWVAQQNERTRQALDARPDRGQWHERLVALMRLPVVLQAKVRGDRLFVLERPAGDEQYSLILRSSTDSNQKPRTLVDPAQLSADAATAIDWFFPSSDGRLVAYGTSEGGTEDSTLAILDVQTGQHHADRIPDTRGATVAWLPDGSAFYYVSYPAGDQYNRRILLHRLGDDPDDAELLWSDPDRPAGWADVHISPSGRYVLIEVSVGASRIAEAKVWDRETRTWATVFDTETSASFSFLDDQLLIATTIDAPRGRVVIAPLSDPSSDNWRTVVPEGDGVIGAAMACNGEILVVRTDRAVDSIERWTVSGEHLGPCGDFGVVSVSGLATDGSEAPAFVTVTGFDQPAALHRVRPGNVVQPWATTDAAVIPDLAVTTTTYRSLDGTPIGLFVIHRAGKTPGPDTPAILNGYGGFAITETPMWSPLIAAWCSRGGLYAIAGLRGGLEEGEPWHHAGRRANKQNVFDDFHAAADHLVDAGLTSRDRLAIAGGSNGGLLVGAALTQRPDLCRAVWCAVPLLDMVRFPHFLIARLWTDEYGDPDVDEEFGWLWGYSPYHRVQNGGTYPAVLLSTAEGDTRVDPLHARKMTAELQWAAADQGARPILLLQEGRAGHGVGKPVAKRADEGADVLAFFAWQLGGPS
jgi:prolyl oligopeptidase